MREIKFRAWIPSEQRMAKVGHIRFDEGTKSSPELVGVELRDGGGNANYSGKIDGGRINAFYLMQFTGLKDKNGIEVYDGDIIKSNDKWRFEVFWSDYSAGFSATYVGGSEKDPGFSPAITPTTMGAYEVIGNVWENPDLLEEK